MQRNEPIDAETLLSTPLPPVRWLIPGLLPAGLSLLAGASKAGKSWLCLWLCLQLARGSEIWGRITVASMGEVLPQGNPPKSLRGQPRTPVRLLAHEKTQCRDQCPRQRHRETKNDADG